MGEQKESLVEPLLKSGSVYKLKCYKCDSISIQITESKEPDCVCLECGGICSSLKIK
ncbi:hypothetical protein [Paraclostridium benzoelyticum]|uniref:hypothetical protein n=1 Tax=Paraclostridium benzoelyticum TaxID=1629550 RepID=UPI0013792BD1|nr:hypothetical protein [Paraclostridium benzoelyticum]